ncbi:calphotin-like [Oryza brachyantha]|uniref:calphotin-like n=1 Tax=Oryza brachyantha TaxID=4533 RepID=UPI0003EAB3E6|nr:calphotin-like [Oryza brachyantha]
MASTSSSPDTLYEIPEPTPVVPTISRSGRPIEYSTSVLPAIGHGAPSPSEYIKRLSGPPSPLRRPKRSKKCDRAPKKKLKITTEAIPLETTSADMDAAIDAAADDDSDTNVRQKSPVKSSADAIPVASDAIDPIPAAGAVPIPPSPTHAPSPAGLALKSGKKHKMVVHCPSRRVTSSAPPPDVSDAITPSANPDPVPAPITEEVILPASSPTRPIDVVPMAQDLGDFFSFDVDQYLDPFEADTDEPIDLPVDLRAQLQDILARLDYPIDTLISDARPIRSRIEEIQDKLPDDLIDVIAPTGYIESHRIPVLRARQRMTDGTS